MPYPASSTGGAAYGGPVTASYGPPTVKRGRRQRPTDEPARRRPAASRPVKVMKAKKPRRQVSGPPVIPYGRRPITAGSSVTNNQLDRAANAAVTTQYGPAGLDLQQRYAASDRLMQQAPVWWQNFQNQMQGIASRDAAAQQQVNQQFANLAFTQGNGAALQSQQDLAAMQADAALRGATVDPQAAQRAVQAQAINLANIGDQGRLAATYGQNAGIYFRGQEAAGAKRGIEAIQGEIAYRRNTLDPQAAELARERGAAKQKYKTDTLSTERQRVLDQQVADWATQKDQADLTLKEQQLQQQAARDRRSARQSKQKLRQQQRQYRRSAGQKDRQLNISQQNANANTTRATRSPSRTGLTPSQQATLRTQISTIANWYQNPPVIPITEPEVDDKTGKPTGKRIPTGRTRPMTAAEITQMLTRGDNPFNKPFSPELIHVAQSLAANKGRGIGPWGRSNARKAGVQVKGYYPSLPAYRAAASHPRG